MVSEHHQEFLRKKRNQKLLRWTAVFLIFVGLVALASFLVHRRQVRITFVELHGGVLITQDDVSQATLSYLSGSYFWLFPKNNILWYPKSSLENYLREQFPRIATISVHLKNLRTLEVDVSERNMEALWCAGQPTDDASLAQCYFLDSNGTIFASAPQFSGDAYLRYYGLVDAAHPIGQNYLASTTEFAQLSQFADDVKGNNLSPVSISTDSTGQFTMTLSSGTHILFTGEESADTLASNISALMRAQDFPSDISKVDYIDLRYGNKLFYKLK